MCNDSPSAQSPLSPMIADARRRSPGYYSLPPEQPEQALKSILASITATLLLAAAFRGTNRFISVLRGVRIYRDARAASRLH